MTCAERSPIDERERADDAARALAWASGRRLLAALLVPVLLVLTQQAALVHELGHFVQQVQRSDGPDRQSNGGDFCEKCLAFAHLSGASPSAPPSVLPLQSDNECPVPRETAGRPAESTVCRIRGPPFYL
jgi:hypothetical protein